MINTEPGKKLGRIYIPFHYGEERLGMIVSYLTIVPISIEPQTYNFEIVGTCEFFEPLDDMESVPTYDLAYRWESNYKGIKSVKLTRSG